MVNLLTKVDNTDLPSADKLDGFEQIGKQLVVGKMKEWLNCKETSNNTQEGIMVYRCNGVILTSYS